MFLFPLLIIMFIDNSSSRIVDWHMSNNCNILLTRYIASFVGKVVAFVSHYPKSPRGNVIWYGELLYTCNKKISEFHVNVSCILWLKL